MLAIEQQFDDQSSEEQSIDAGQLAHPLLASQTLELSEPTQLNESLDHQSAVAINQTNYLSGPIRAGPQFTASALECGGDCHLSLVLRQVAVDTVAVEVELISSETGIALVFGSPILATADISTLGSRGPPSIA